MPEISNSAKVATPKKNVSQKEKLSFDKLINLDSDSYKQNLGRLFFFLVFCGFVLLVFLHPISSFNQSKKSMDTVGYETITLPNQETEMREVEVIEVKEESEVVEDKGEDWQIGNVFNLDWLPELPEISFETQTPDTIEKPEPPEQNEALINTSALAGIGEFFTKSADQPPKASVSQSQQAVQRSVPTGEPAIRTIEVNPTLLQQPTEKKGQVIYRPNIGYKAGSDKFDVGTTLEVTAANATVELVVDKTTLLPADTVLLVNEDVFRELGANPQESSDLSVVAKIK